MRVSDAEFFDLFNTAASQLSDRFTLQLDTLQEKLGDDPQNTQLRQLRKEQLLNLLKTQVT